jgi:DNA-binding GntR family transcriptional regulator
MLFSKGIYLRHSTVDIYIQIQQKILYGDYAPASALIETELAEEYGVSRNTIKKVLLMLESKSLVTIEPNKSARVRSYTLNEVLDYMQIREVLEGLIVQLAVPHITEEQIASLQEALSKMKEYLDNKELLKYSECNYQFHQIIYDACPNHTLIEIVVGLKNQISKFGAKTILIPGRDEQSYREHTAIFDSIVRHDCESASILVQRHIHNVAQTIREYGKLIL